MYASYVKRWVDVLGSALLLVLLSWLFAVIFLLFLLSFSRPIIFRQARIGKAKRIFVLYKFRSLRSDDTLPLSERTFPLGNILRRTSLDELPQLINVLRGDMSLIGPRPLPVEYFHKFSTAQDRRHAVNPGITGLAQVNGRHRISWQRKFDYDLWYIENLNFWMDLKIAMKTVVAIFVSNDSSLSEEPFKGSK